MRTGRITLCLIAFAAAIVTLLSQPTVAYYSVKGAATSVVTSGDISAEIIEKMGEADFPEQGVMVMPGSTVSKKVMVKNVGTHPFWVRIKLENGIDDPTLSADVFKIDLNDRDWIDGGDGFFYYHRPLEAGEVTEKLFSEVHVAGTLDNRYATKTLKLIVKAYAVQSEHNSAASPTEVAGWPEER